MNKKPPEIAQWILKRTSQFGTKFSIMGDFEEEYKEIVADKGAFKAWLWYWGHVGNSLPTFIKDSIYRRSIMLKNYLKISLRNVRKYKAYSFINIFGLAIGMACFSLIMLYVRHEVSYDDFHAKTKNIYRLITDFKSPANEYNFATSIYAEGNLFTENFSEVEEAVKLLPARGTLVKNGDINYYENLFVYTNNTFFSIFDFRLIEGDRSTVLEEPGSIILSESMAKKYFPGGGAMGRALTITNNFETEATFTVKGIIEDSPSNTNIAYDFLVSSAAIDGSPRDNINNLGQLGFMWTYVVLSEDVSYRDFEEKIKGFLDEKLSPQLRQATGISLTPRLQPISEIHLYQGLNNDLPSRSDIKYVYIFSTIAAFILLLACINFMNLATAKSVSRSREVGMRKVLGAFRKQLVNQFLGESVILALVALVVSLVIVQLVLPSFNALTNRTLTLDYLADLEFVSFMVGSALLVGLISGSYPALFLSSFNPISIFKGKSSAGSGNSNVRSTLVVMQFAISIILIIGTGVVSSQLDYFKNKDLGFNSEQIMVLTTNNGLPANQLEPFKNELLANSEIKTVTASSFTPGENAASAAIFNLVDEDNNAQKTIQNNTIDFDYIKTYGFEIVQGRDFNREVATDLTQAIIVNEMLVKELGWEENPIGKRLGTPNAGGGGPGNQGPPPILSVVGVVKDFHHFSLQRPIVPFIFFVNNQVNSRISIKFEAESVSKVIQYVENTWRNFAPGFPLSYAFVDENFASRYQSQERFGNVFKYFSGLAMIIACLGLFGLASFAAEQRTKEIGIRKVLGSTVSSIIILLTKEFTKWVLVANIIAWPIAYYAMDKYLDTFANRIDIGIWIFMIAAALTFIIALGTVSMQAMKSAVSNPINALRLD